MAVCPRPNTATRSLQKVGDVDQLDGMTILAGRTLASMMHQVHLFMARFGRVPGNALHGHVFSHLVSSLWSFARQARLSASVLAQQACDSGFADLAQLLLYLAAQAHTPEARQMPCRRK